MGWFGKAFEGWVRSRHATEVARNTRYQLEVGERPVCWAVHWHADTRRNAVDLLTTRRWFCRWMYDNGRGYGPGRPWIRLDEIAALSVVGRDLALAVRRDGPCTLSRQELPLWATVLRGRSPEVSRFHHNLISYATSAQLVPPPPVSLSSLHEAGEWLTLDFLIPPGSPLRRELEDGQRVVVEWDERYGRRSLERHARQMEEKREAREDHQRRAEVRRQRMDELYRKRGIDPDKRLGRHESE